MTRIEQEKFRAVLKKKQSDLEHEGSSGREALAIEESADELDRIQHAQARDFALDGLDRNAKLLREVRAALTRVAVGTFGICVDCEKHISVKRLAAVPWTASCIGCQEATETACQPRGLAEETSLATAD